MIKNNLNGFTIVELMVAVLVFGILSTILVLLLRSGMRGYDRAHVASQAREFTRQAVERITGEIRQGVPLPIEQNGKAVFSSILLPHSYDPAINDGNYMRPQIDNINNNNSIIFTQVIEGAANTKDLTSYRYVVYRTQNNEIQRLIYNVVNGGQPRGVTQDINGRWLPDGNFFNVTAPIEAMAVVKLPRIEDRISFTFKHLYLSETTTQQFNPDPAKPIFDPNLYTLTVRVRQFDLEELKKTENQRNPVQVELDSTVKVEGTFN